MLAITISALVSVILIGTIMYVECKIVVDLPESNSFKRWWRKYLIKRLPEDL